MVTLRCNAVDCNKILFRFRKSSHVTYWHVHPGRVSEVRVLEDDSSLALFRLLAVRIGTVNLRHLHKQQYNIRSYTGL